MLIKIHSGLYVMKNKIMSIYRVKETNSLMIVCENNVEYRINFEEEKQVLGAMDYIYKQVNIMS